MSPQPIFGGPVYFIRNVVYNSVYGPLKIQADPSGILVYQNTFTSARFSRSRRRRTCTSATT